MKFMSHRLGRKRSNAFLKTSPVLCEALEPRLLLSAELARSADAFVDSIGVGTHLGKNGVNSSYNYPQVLTDLGNIGIRHIRGGGNQLAFDRMKSLFDSYGITSNLVVDNYTTQSNSPTTLAQQLAQNWTEAVEGGNEPDLQTGQYIRQYKNLVDSPSTNEYYATIAYQQDLYNAIKNTPGASGKKVLSPAMGSTRAGFAIPSTLYDVDSIHSYIWPLDPNAPWVNNYNFRPADFYAGGKPKWVTETGYTTGTSDKAVPVDIQAKYIPRTLFEYFNRGIERTFLYEFADEPDLNYTTDPVKLDQEQNFGLEKFDMTTHAYTPKPVYTQLKNMISLLKESTFDTATKTWNKPSFTPGTLDYTIEGDTSDVHHTLLQKSNGEFYLVLWRDQSSWDSKNKTNTNVSAKYLTLNVNTPLSSANEYLLSNTSPLLNFTNKTTFTIAAFDEIAVVKLTPKASTTPVGTTVTVTAGDSSIAERTSATNAAIDDGTFIVSRTGSTTSALTVNYTVAGSATAGTDYDALSGSIVIPAGQSSVTITVHPHADLVTEGNESVILNLASGSGYTIGDKFSGQLTIKDDAPDLVVESITWDVAQPKVGDHVTFSAVVRNIGTRATDHSFGIIFSTDNRADSGWSTSGSIGLSSLAPGATATFKAVATGDTAHPYPYWDAAAGKHSISAFVDDQNGLAESNESNNVSFAFITVDAVQIHDDFQSQTPGTAPAGWTSNTGGNWQVTDYGGRHVVESLAQISNAQTQTLTRAFSSTVTGGWSLDFLYDWKWGGVPSGHGMNSPYIGVDLVDDSGNGYRIRIHEGNSDNSTVAMVDIYKLTNGTATLFSGAATGVAINRAGWASRGLKAPDVLRGAHIIYDPGLGLLNVYEDVNGDGIFSADELAASVADRSWLNFSKIIMAGGTSATDLDAMVPLLDDIKFSGF